MAAKFTLQFTQGATFRHTFVLTQPGGQPVDLTGASASLEVRSRYGEKELIVRFDANNGQLAITPATGTISLFADDAATAALGFKNTADAVMRVVFSNGDVMLLKGTAALDETA